MKMFLFDYGCTLLREAFLVVCPVQVVGTTSSEDFPVVAGIRLETIYCSGHVPVRIPRDVIVTSRPRLGIPYTRVARF